MQFMFSEIFSNPDFKKRIFSAKCDDEFKADFTNNPQKYYDSG